MSADFPSIRWNLSSRIPANATMDSPIAGDGRATHHFSAKQYATLQKMLAYSSQLDRFIGESRRTRLTLSPRNSGKCLFPNKGRRRRTAARDGAASGDLSRLLNPLPPDHDDDHGGITRRGADRGGIRLGRRSAATAGAGSGRRPAVLAVGDALLTPVFYTYMASFQTW